MKKISLFFFLLIILIDDIKSQCSGSACECAGTASITEANPCTNLKAKENHKCIAKEAGEEGIDTYPCKEKEIEKVKDCKGSVCACAKVGETTTCTGLTVEKDHKCVVDTDNTKADYACLEKEIEKVSGCNGSMCACAKKSENPTCSELTAQENYKCEDNTDNSKADYACKETANSTSTSEETKKEDNSQTSLSVSLMICLIILFLKF